MFFAVINMMDCKLLYDILRVSFKMRTTQNLEMDFKSEPTFWQPWLHKGTQYFLMNSFKIFLRVPENSTDL